MLLRKIYNQSSKRMIQLLSKPKHQLTEVERQELQEYLNDTESEMDRKVKV
jgi:hypothetical protein